MKCTQCGAELAPGARYCSECWAVASSQPPDAHPSATDAGATGGSTPALSGRLVVEIGPDEGKEFPLRGTMRIGRTEDNEITLADAQASRHHAAISPEPGGFAIQDLNSSNGTFVNGKRLDEPRLLKEGDRLRVANTVLAFRWESTPSMPSPATPPVTPPAPDYASLPTTEVAWQTPPAGLEHSPPPQATEPRKGRSTGRIVLGAGLAVVFLVVAAAAAYFFLGNPDGDKSSRRTGETAPAAITQVVTSAPAPVVTMIVTSVPVATATVAPTATPSGPVTVHVAPDGSGDYASLEEAIEAVPAGSTIQLDAGTYVLASPLEIVKSLALRGAGMDQTYITGTTGEQMILFVGPGAFAAEGITFRYEGTDWNRVTKIEDAEIDIARCRFTGAIWGEENLTGGDGLLLKGNTTGSVRDSRFEGNELHGLEILGQGQLVLEGNIAADNGQAGIHIADSAGGEAIGNECVNNGLHGIAVGDEAQPTLKDNVCSDNEEAGIRYYGASGGVAVGNRCERNGLHGISVLDDAQPTLEGNFSQDNVEDGFRFSGSAGGVARDNTCTGNGLHGFEVVDQAQPTLEGNICSDNQEVGIRYSGAAGGMALGNTCDRNGLHGISVTDQAQPTLEGNSCQDNTELGIRYSGSAGGIARENISTGNGLHGFLVKEEANPTLEGNRSNYNIEGGFIYFDSAGGVARQNECIGNKWGIYVEDTAAPELVDNDCRDNAEADIDDGRQPAQPAFGPITFAKDKTDANEPIDPTNTFPAGTLRVYALFDYEGMSTDLEWGRTWYRNGEEYVSNTESWTGEESGTWSLWLFRTGGDPLAPATYELRLYIQGKQVQSATFVINE